MNGVVSWVFYITFFFLRRRREGEKGERRGERRDFVGICFFGLRGWEVGYIC